MTDSIQTTKKLEQIIREHFPNTSEKKAKKHSEKIYSRFDLGRAMERIRQSNIKPQSDIKNLRQAARHLERAVTNLSELGWHGGEQLVSTAKFIKKDESIVLPSQTLGVSITEASEVICAELTAIEKALSNAADLVNVDGQSPLEPLGEGYKKGSPKKTAAYHVAQQCYKTFKKCAEASPRRATVHIDSKRTAPGGPFYCFVESVFLTLNIEANAEHQIKMVMEDIDRSVEESAK